MIRAVSSKHGASLAQLPADLIEFAAELAGPQLRFLLSRRKIRIVQRLCFRAGFNTQRTTANIQGRSYFSNGLLQNHSKFERLANRRRNSIDGDFAARLLL